jgi:hypothetical protein
MTETLDEQHVSGKPRTSSKSTNLQLKAVSTWRFEIVQQHEGCHRLLRICGRVVVAAINDPFSLASVTPSDTATRRYRPAVLGYRGLGRSDRCTTQTRRIFHTPHTFA